MGQSLRGEMGTERKGGRAQGGERETEPKGGKWGQSLRGGNGDRA